MASKDGKSLKSTKSISLFGLPLNWGTQLTISVLGAGFCWWFSEKWTVGRSFPAVRTVSERLWQIAPSLVSMALSIVCLLWGAALFIKINVWTEPRNAENDSDKGSPTRMRGLFFKRFLAFFLLTIVAAVFYGLSAELAYRYYPAAAGRMTAIAGILSLLGMFVFIPRIIRGGRVENDRSFPETSTVASGMRHSGSPRWWVKSSKWLPTILFLAIFFAPFQMVGIEWRIASLVGVLLWPLAVHQLKLRIYRLGFEGSPKQALRLNRICLWIPSYGESFEGLILFNDGKYKEARAFLRPLAFDEKGRPRLLSLELYSYALALVNDGCAAEAEPLLEAAARVKQPADSLEIALANCLLTLRKDANRACNLLEKAMATPQLRITAYGKAAAQASRIGQYAWALASAGRRDEAETAIQNALQMSSKLTNTETGSVRYFVGEAWESLGNIQSARDSYEQVLALRPDGVVALSAQKALRRLDVIV
jgi:hypothetical protein